MGELKRPVFGHLKNSGLVQHFPETQTTILATHGAWTAYRKYIGKDANKADLLNIVHNESRMRSALALGNWYDVFTITRKFADGKAGYARIAHLKTEMDLFKDEMAKIRFLSRVHSYHGQFIQNFDDICVRWAGDKLQEYFDKKRPSGGTVDTPDSNPGA